MIALNRSVMVSVLEHPSRAKGGIDGGGGDHDDAGAGQAAGDSPGDGADAHLARGREPIGADRASDRTPVCPCADRRTHGDRPPLAGPALEPPVGRGAAGEGPRTREEAVPRFRADVRRREAARTASPRPLALDAASRHDPRRTLDAAAPQGPAPRLAPTAGVCRGGGAARWL